MKLVVAILSLAMACNCAPVGIVDWGAELVTFFTTFSNLWASQQFADLVKNLYVCDPVLIGPGGENSTVTDPAVLTQSYVEMYAAGWTVFQVDSIEKIFPSGDMTAVSWVKYSFLFPADPNQDMIGRAMLHFVNHWGEIKIQMIMFRSDDN